MHRAAWLFGSLGSLGALGSLGLLVGCGGAAPQLAVHRELVGGEALQADQPPAREVAARCARSRRVRVIDAHGAPVAGARVVAEQRVSEHASEETLAVWRYRSREVATDAHGLATTCAPGALNPRPHCGMSIGCFDIEGIGGGFTDRDAGTISVRAGGREVRVADPGGPTLDVQL